MGAPTCIKPGSTVGPLASRLGAWSRRKGPPPPRRRGPRQPCRTEIDGSETPLLEAAAMGHPEVVRLLLEYGADPEDA